ncbi:hypothetical protein GJ496_009982 [Pomphorhynchus laevis]|nr:hypothetical protein GJ496_009982 [Pomphorhynchus laevis]
MGIAGYNSTWIIGDFNNNNAEQAKSMLSEIMKVTLPLAYTFHNSKNKKSTIDFAFSSVRKPRFQISWLKNLDTESHDNGHMVVIWGWSEISIFKDKFAPTLKERKI